jgi:hypothetical protein
MKWFLERLREPSTWAGFAALIPAVLSMVATGVTPAALGGLVAGAAAVLIKEPGNVS